MRHIYTCDGELRNSRKKRNTERGGAVKTVGESGQLVRDRAKRRHRAVAPRFTVIYRVQFQQYMNSQFMQPARARTRCPR